MKSFRLINSRPLLIGVSTVLFSLHKSSYLKHSCDSTINLTNSTVNKISGHSYNANDPTEDRWVAAYDNTSDTTVGCVFDGHGGWQVSEYLSKLLPSLLNKYSKELQSNNNKLREQTIINIFQQLEDSYINLIKDSYKLGFGSVAKVGSCVILAYKVRDQLTIANLGDCRAVLGSTNNHSNDKIYATRLTNDHNCREKLEDFKLRSEHPNEDNIIVCKSSHACYVKGKLQLTRAIGDLYLKKAEFNLPGQTDGRSISEPYTPPYVNHLPDVITLQLDKTDRFLVLATDGVWDFLSDQEVIDIVSEYNDPIKASEAVVEATLHRAAIENRFTIDQLKSLPPGRKRRTKHDDTTAVVIYF